jgi:hypothetical protein
LRARVAVPVGLRRTPRLPSSSASASRSCSAWLCGRSSQGAPLVRAHWRGGMVASLLTMAGLEDWPAPDFSTLCRRQSETGPWPQWGRVSLSNGQHPDPLPPHKRRPPPAGGQRRGEDARRWRMAGPQARPWPAAPMAQGASGHGCGQRGHPGRGVHLQPDRRQPGAARSAGADPGRRADRRRHGGWGLRHQDLPRRHRGARRRRPHPDPQERPPLERGRPRRPGQERDPASLKALRSGARGSGSRATMPEVASRPRCAA